MGISEPRLSCVRKALGALTADPESLLWRAVPGTALVDTVTGAPPCQATRLSLAWDGEELRVLFAAEDTHVWATLTERGGPLYTEEVVEVFLDPVGDGECYFEIEVNPLNAVLDLVLRRNRSGYRKDFGWDCAGFRSEVRRLAAGWAAELSIPFASLVAVAPMPGDRWRGNFTRIDRPVGRERELSAWAPTGQANFHVPERFGAICFEPAR